MKWDQKVKKRVLSHPKLINQLRKTPIEFWCPEPGDVLNAFRFTTQEEVKVVILGQDPYIKGGLSFSSKLSRILPSLRIIYKELLATTGISRSSPDDWAQQGVLLLNTILTTTRGESLAHKGFGWEDITTEILKELSHQPLVVMLWGKYAQTYWRRAVPHILELNAPHPAAGLYGGPSFIGCGHFNKCNVWLKEHNIDPVNW